MEYPVFMKRHQNKGKKNILYIAILICFAVVGMFVTLGYGVYQISISDATKVVFDHILGNDVNYHDDLYVFGNRLPRAILAVLIGAGLALSGVVMQNIMRNPMADPYTMGISSGSFFGAVLSIALGWSLIPWISDDYSIVVNAFVFSMIPMGIILVLTRFKRMSSTAMILTGIAIMYLFSSITQMILVKSSSEAMATAYSWRVGTLAFVDWDVVWYVLPVVSICSVLLYAMGKKLDVMYTGDNVSKTLGVNPDRLRIVCMLIVSLITAITVSFTGTIGFVGLVAPHVARMFVGSSNKYLMPFSMALGAAFLVAADTIAKVCGASGLPVGVISSLVGGPVFLYILIKRGKKVWT